MVYTFESKVDLANNILITHMTGYCPSLEAYQAWEEDFVRTWQENFGQQKTKILMDQRGYKTATPETVERAIALREQIKGSIIASAWVVDDPIAVLQMKRLSAETEEIQEVEKFFEDFDEALAWLKAQ